MKTQTCMCWRNLPESIKNAISFDVIQVENLKIFRERLLLVVILCFRQWHIFQKWGVFQQFKGRGHEKFSRGQAPGTPFFLASLAPPFSPLNMKYVPTGLIYLACLGTQKVFLIRSVLRDLIVAAVQLNALCFAFGKKLGGKKYQAIW